MFYKWHLRSFEGDAGGVGGNGNGIVCRKLKLTKVLETPWG